MDIKINNIWLPMLLTLFMCNRILSISTELERVQFIVKILFLGFNSIQITNTFKILNGVAIWILLDL
jgi:hypothetical protein